MPLAARVLDLTNHPGAIGGPGGPLVFIENKLAARVGDLHACAFPPPSGPHPPNTIVQGSVTVFIGKQQAARLGDACGCGAQIASSAFTVHIG